MPFCSQCGNAVTAADRFCGRCGAKQPGGSGGSSGVPHRGDLFSGISARTASILCYVPWVGWVAAVIVLAAHRFREDRAVRFHAFQGLYLFVAWLINEWVLGSFGWRFARHGLHGLIAAVLLIASIFMMVKAAHEETYSLPLFGELAERSVEEN